MDRPLEDLLRALLESDPHAQLDDRQREAMMYGLLGVLSKPKCEAIWKFTDSISDEIVRSHLLHKFVQKIPWAYYSLAKPVADSIPIAYWRYSAVIHVASEMLKWAGTANVELRNQAFEFIREAEIHVPLVDEDDRSTIVWEAGLLLVKAGELDWAEKLAVCESYCPENTEVLLSVAKARAQKGEKSHALEIARKVAELASTAATRDANPAFNALEVAEFCGALGQKAESRRHLETSLVLAIASDTAGNIDACKCIRAVALQLAKEGNISEATEAAKKIRHDVQRSRVLQEVSDIAVTSQNS